MKVRQFENEIDLKPILSIYTDKSKKQSYK